MKVEVQGDRWPAHMRGREITIYMPTEGTPEFEDAFNATITHPVGYWIQMVAEIDVLLLSNGVALAPVCEGDLPFGLFSSLRNEHCVVVDGSGQRVYPPNACGWNAARDECLFPEDVLTTVQTYAAVFAGQLPPLPRRGLSSAAAGSVGVGGVGVGEVDAGVGGVGDAASSVRDGDGVGIGAGVSVDGVGVGVSGSVSAALG